MYSTDVVIPAVKKALKRRGFVYPKHKSGISREAVMSRRLAYAALVEFSFAKSSFIATLIGCAPSTAIGIGELENYGIGDKAEVRDWLQEVRKEMKIG